MSNLSHGAATGVIGTRESVVAVLELLETRMPYSSARALISEAGIHASRGWRETLSRAREDIYSESIWTRAYGVLSQAALNHTYVGNKHVHIFDLRDQNADNRERVLDWAKNRAVRDLQSIRGKRPFGILNAPTRKDRLEPFKGKPPKLIELGLVDEKLYMQFFTTRSYSIREELDISKMSAANARTFEEYEELIGVKTLQVPCFDTVVFDIEKELVEFRTDFQVGMTEDKKSPAFVWVMNVVNEMTTRFISQPPVGVGLMNFYPAIDRMYQDQNCGRVTALGFVATSADTSSNNHGQIHRRKTQDFRKDHFHVGGKKSVNAVEPYAIGITWDQPDTKTDLELELKGSVRAIYAGNARGVSMAEVIGCMNATDYEFVLDQMLSRLKRRSK